MPMADLQMDEGTIDAEKDAGVWGKITLFPGALVLFPQNSFCTPNSSFRLNFNQLNVLFFWCIAPTSQENHTYFLQTTPRSHAGVVRTILDFIVFITVIRDSNQIRD